MSSSQSAAISLCGLHRLSTTAAPSLPQGSHAIRMATLVVASGCGGTAPAAHDEEPPSRRGRRRRLALSAGAAHSPLGAGGARARSAGPSGLEARSRPPRANGSPSSSHRRTRIPARSAGWANFLSPRSSMARSSRSSARVRRPAAGGARVLRGTRARLLRREHARLDRRAGRRRDRPGGHAPRVRTPPGPQTGRTRRGRRSIWGTKRWTSAADICAR